MSKGNRSLFRRVGLLHPNRAIRFLSLPFTSCHFIGLFPGCFRKAFDQAFAIAMEPFPPVDPLFKEAYLGPQVQINELPLSRPGPQNASNLRRANTVAQGGNIIKRNLELKAAREKTAGLRAKDSHEILRHQLQRSQTHRGPLEARPPGRKAGHFTVGSVGQNGKIFLR